MIFGIDKKGKNFDLKTEKSLILMFFKKIMNPFFINSGSYLLNLTLENKSGQFKPRKKNKSEKNYETS